jgi:tetratricopeptide (TPR) repeat protein/serine phosphatase RsbU (regulator of sigma subunit)
VKVGRKFKVFFVIVFLFSVNFLKGEDSIAIKLKTIKYDSSKISFLESYAENLLKKYPDSAYKYIEKAVKISKSGSNCCFCDLLLLKAKYYKSVSSYDYAYKSVSKAVKCYETNKLQTKKVAEAYNLLAMLDYNYSKYDDAISNFKKAANLYSKFGDSAMIASLYINVGNVNVVLGQIKDAIKLYNKAFSVASSMGDSVLIARILNNMGVVYNGIGKREAAIENYHKALEIYKKLDKKEKVADEYNNLGVVYKKLGNYDKAIYYYNEARKMYEQLGKYGETADQYNNIGLVFYDKGDYKNAVDNLIKAVEIYDKEKAIKGLVNSTLNISMVYIDEKDYNNAIVFLKKTVKFALSLGMKKQLAMAYRLFGRIYTEEKNYEKAINFLIRSITIENKTGNKDGLASSYDKVGNLYLEKGEPLKAITYFTKSLKIYKDLSQKKGLASVYSNIAKAYYEAYQVTKNPDFLNKAIENGEKAYKISKYKDFLSERMLVSKILKNAYRDKGDKDKALFFADEYENLRDTMFAAQKQKIIYEIQAKFESKQKEQELKLKNEQIARINAEKQKQEVEIKSEKRIRIFISVGAIILLVLVVFIYRNYRQKSHYSALLEQKNKEIEIANAKLNQLLEEVLSQRDELEEQKTLLEEVHGELKNSIKYAEKIQMAILPSTKYLKDKVADCFIMYLPRDIVSGDFYWFSQVGNKLVFIVADCTGHGVPGAFMSILGISLLREIVEVKGVTKPDEILNNLRQEIIYALSQGDSLDRQDGMDMSVITVDKKEGYVEYSGANNSIFVVGDNLTVLSGDENRIIISGENNRGEQLYELKPDKMPIGIYPKEERFTSLKFSLSEKMNIYMFTDGYADQFGGEHGKKLKKVYFKNIIMKYSYADMNTQKQFFDSTFYTWKGAYEQIDDVTLVGLKF